LLLERAPKKFNKYIEPFVGGGALLFTLPRGLAVIGDSNPELINAYECVARNVEQVIAHLRTFKNRESDYYKIRALHFGEQEKEFAAARTIYLNRTCFNGLYRVNKQGQFNVPFGRYKQASFCQPDVLRAASAALRGVEILLGDYKDVLAKTA